MRVLTTVLKQTEGMVSLDGILYNEGNYEKIQKKIGYLPQEIDLYPNLTVKECLVYMGGLSGVSRNDLEQRITGRNTGGRKKAHITHDILLFKR